MTKSPEDRLREPQCCLDCDEVDGTIMHSIADFAASVAKDAVEAEREACAKAAEMRANLDGLTIEATEIRRGQSRVIAADIRARSAQPAEEAKT